MFSSKKNPPPKIRTIRGVKLAGVVRGAVWPRSPAMEGKTTPPKTVGMYGGIKGDLGICWSTKENEFMLGCMFVEGKLPLHWVIGHTRWWLAVDPIIYKVFHTYQVVFLARFLQHQQLQVPKTAGFIGHLVAGTQFFSSWWLNQPVGKICQIGSSFQVGVKIKIIWNHHLVLLGDESSMLGTWTCLVIIGWNDHTQ